MSSPLSTAAFTVRTASGAFSVAEELETQRERVRTMADAHRRSVVGSGNVRLETASMRPEVARDAEDDLGIAKAEALCAMAEQEAGCNLLEGRLA